MNVLLVSPHLDDVAFSCGALAHRLAREGHATTLCTVFTRSMPSPRGFALACQLDKGLGADVDYMALRRAEDARAAVALAVTRVEWLDLPEAPHRGYDSAAALFGAYAERDAVAPAVRAALEPLIAHHDLTLAPLAYGAHVDHRRVAGAVLSLAPAAVAWYADAPYVVREPRASSPLAALAHVVPLAHRAAQADLAAKLDACAAYASQLGFQFGDEAAMRAALGAYDERVTAEALPPLPSARRESPGEGITPA